MKTDHETIDPELERMLHEIRELPEPDFARKLDERVAAGFGGARRPGTPGAWERLVERFRRTPPRRIVARLGATAVAGIVIATAVVAIDVPRADDDAASLESLDAPAASRGGGEFEDQALTESAGSPEASPTPDAIGATSGTTSLNGRAVAPTGPFAADQNRRFIERSANLTLGTDPEDVRDVADEVFGIVGRYEGIVLSSSIQDGPEGEAGARFELMIPSERLSDALADLSGVAEVRSREEQTLDITAPTVTVGERLQDARAEVEGLLEQLADADTDEERAAVKQQLAFQRQRVASLRSTLSRLERRANLSRVSLQVVTGDEATFPGPGGGDDEWTFTDAIDDAGQILSIAAGVTVIGLAVLAPFALLFGLAWLVRRAWIRQGRERALEA